MTHTLHRRGGAAGAGDLVVVVMAAKHVTDHGAAAKLRAVLELALRHGAVNAGDMKSGSLAGTSHAELTVRLHDHSIVNAVFVDIAVLGGFLAELRRLELGLSVVVSGPLAAIFDLCRTRPECGTPHTVALSLGVWGPTELLPPEQDLDIATMCGHALIAPAAIAGARTAVALGAVGPDQAAAQLARHCVCGAFNPRRAAALLRDAPASHAESSGPGAEEP